MARAARLSITVVVALACATAARAAAAADPWAPGASAEPWPLIARLQSSAAVGADANAWRRALGHDDPLVRAAAAWAAGRTGTRNVGRTLAPLVVDAEPMVRDAALWAALHSDEPEAFEAVLHALRVRRDIGIANRLGDLDGHLQWLIRQRGLIAGPHAEERRAWLDRTDLAAIRPLPEAPWTRTGLVAMSWSLARSEWDADERVTIRAELRSAAAREGQPPGSLPLQTHLVPLDPPTQPPSSSPRLPKIAVTLHRAQAAVDGDQVRLEPGRSTSVDLVLPLHELPPGPYLLKPFGPGHPLLLRVRRSARREADVQAAAAAARTAEEIDAAGLYRVASAARRFRARFRAMTRPPRVLRTLWTPDPVFWSLAAALGRMGDAPSAGLLVEALSTMPVAHRPRAGQLGEVVRAEDPLVARFGPVALPHLARAAAWWPRDHETYGAQEFALSALRLPVGSPELDAARLDHLRAVVRRMPDRQPPRPNVYPGDSHDMALYKAAWIGIAPRDPEAAGQALGSLADRPYLFEWALDLIDPHVAYSYPPPTFDVDVVERILRAAWSVLLPGAEEARAMISGEAVRLRLAWPEASQPPTARTAIRELQRARVAAPETARMVLDRVRAAGLPERDDDIARAAGALAGGLESAARRATPR